ARSAARREAPDTRDPAAAELNAALAALDARDARTTVQRLMRDVLNDTEQRVMTLHYGLEMELDAITTALGLTNLSGAKAFIVSARRKLNVAVKRWKTKS